MPLSYLRLRRATARALQEVEPELLFVEFAQTATILLGLQRPFAALRPHDVNWFLMEQRLSRLNGPRRWLTSALSRFFRWFEPWLCRRYDQILAISVGDQRLLAPRCAPQPVELLPLAPGLPADLDVEPAPVPRPNVLFVGAMYRGVNVEAVQWFVERVWPQIRAQVPQAHFTVVGYRPPPEIEALDDEDGITVTGFVDDLAPWYRSAAVFVSPMLVAGGLLQKVLDAQATGVPVVATSVSNHGVGATPGEHLLTADDPANFAAAVVRLLRNPDERKELGQAGQRFVEAQYDLEAAIERWEESWEKISDGA
jgi:glycosyltransferase involved in cell wall biosynthesis